MAVAAPSRTRWLVATGAILGLLVYAFDFDFFLNAGGPNTRISNAILRALQLQNTEYPLNVLVPLLILLVTGAAAGAVVGALITRSANRTAA